MCGVFAELERCMIRKRVDAGRARAKANGTKRGRPTIGPAVEKRIRSLRAEGMGVLRIGRTLGIGTSAVQRVLGAGVIWPYPRGPKFVGPNAAHSGPR